MISQNANFSQDTDLDNFNDYRKNYNKAETAQSFLESLEKNNEEIDVVYIKCAIAFNDLIEKTKNCLLNLPF